MSAGVFVTGGYGLLGSWLVQSLLADGETVTVLRRDEPSPSVLALLDIEKDCNVVSGDIRDPELMQRVLSEYEIDSVFHLAAQTLVGPANRSPVTTFDVNMRGTWTLLEACRLHETSRVVVAASDKAYGPHEQLPYREDHALQPLYPYDVSKAATDLIARSYFHTFGLPVAVTRFANLYGGGDLNPSRLVPELVAAVLADRPPVIRSDGSPERDFLYVEDAVEAYKAIWRALPGAGGEAFNAGSGRALSVRELVETLCRVADSGVAPDIRGEGVPEGEIDRQYVDGGKLRELTGWEPQVSLEEGLVRTIEWYRAHPEALPS